VSRHVGARLASPAGPSGPVRTAASSAGDASVAPTRQGNVLGGFGALLWLVVVGLPLYALVATTFLRQDQYLHQGPLAPPSPPTLASYELVLRGSFFTYLGNTAVVTGLSVAIVVALAVPVGYSVVRSRSLLSHAAFRIFLLGLAIPAQAVIIPVYLIITTLHLYDSLLAVILPTAAFSLPVCVLILTNAMRDVDEQLYEAMALDGARPATTLFRLVIPMTRGGISTVIVYSALQAWNGLLFPLILTQSQVQRTLTLGLYDYQGEYRIDLPALLAAVVLSGIPILALYLFARRALISGLLGLSSR
jgi:xylobiose transport system permease protein